MILDALRKSESQRQQLGNVSLANLPQGRRQTPPWWMIGVGLLLLANLILLVVVLVGPHKDEPAVGSTAAQVLTPQTQARTIQSTSIQPTSTHPGAAQPNNIDPQAVRSTPLSDATLSTPPATYEEVDRSVMEAANRAPDGPTLVQSATPPSQQDQDNINLLTGTAPASVPPLHLDMHVYAPAASSRFVFINGHKYLEGQFLVEGPKVDSIVAEGVVLSMQGSRWRLERP